MNTNKSLLDDVALALPAILGEEEEEPEEDADEAALGLIHRGPRPATVLHRRGQDYRHGLRMNATDVGLPPAGPIGSKNSIQVSIRCSRRTHPCLLLSRIPSARIK